MEESKTPIAIVIIQNIERAKCKDCGGTGRHKAGYQAANKPIRYKACRTCSSSEANA